MRRSVISKILLTLCVALILAYTGFVIWEFSYADSKQICTEMDVNLNDKTGIRLISEYEIAKIIDASGLNPIGSKYQNISTDAIEKELLRNDMIRYAECYKLTTGKVVIDVVQRTPKYLIAGNQSYYVDSERKIMPISLNYAVYVPVVSGRVLRNMASNEIFDFVSYIEKDTFWNAQIEQIFIRDDLKVELIPRVGNAVIMLGKFDNFEKKLTNLQALYQKGLNVVGWTRYNKIDLQYHGQIVCTKTGSKPIIVHKPDTAVIKDSIALKKI
ncbi:MAG: cell division protein FtsQ [Paludibacter sp.]|nr:cell division protein FtsQ [Paludibacter sp.]